MRGLSGGRRGKKQFPLPVRMLGDETKKWFVAALFHDYPVGELDEAIDVPSLTYEKIRKLIAKTGSTLEAGQSLTPQPSRSMFKAATGRLPSKAPTKRSCVRFAALTLVDTCKRSICPLC